MSICNLCGHTLVNNSHGFDQNDAHMEGDELIHHGRCTYCRFCNPSIFEDTSTAATLSTMSAVFNPDPAPPYDPSPTPDPAPDPPSTPDFGGLDGGQSGGGGAGGDF
jgi:hypothetical protein